VKPLTYYRLSSEPVPAFRDKMHDVAVFLGVAGEIGDDKAIFEKGENMPPKTPFQFPESIPDPKRIMVHLTPEMAKTLKQLVLVSNKTAHEIVFEIVKSYLDTMDQFQETEVKPVLPAVKLESA